jgi:type I restriction-modification system DNA methylase subunit
MIEVVCEKYNTVDCFQSLQEQLELFFGKDFEIKSKKPKTNENLGQVFTPPLLAKFMTNLLGTELNTDQSILDPCIGPNTFFNALTEKQLKCFLKGVEVDDRLISESTNKFFNNSKRELIKGSFFDLPLGEKFDRIIQNPPYVRQELLSGGVNSKENIKNKISTSFSLIPSQSNLYIYFLLKSILHLKENGILVAVIYDSWLYSSFGKFLKESFLKLGHLESIYHFRKGAFDDAEVGATVIKFTKKTLCKKSISYYPLNNLDDIKIYGKFEKTAQNIEQKDFLNFTFNKAGVIKVNNRFFAPLKSLTKQPIQRGTSAIVNNYFISNTLQFPEQKPIIKDVSSIDTYGVTKADSYILAVNGNISEKTKEYLDFVKQEILKTPSNKFKAVKRDIDSKKKWFGIKTKQRGNFIFNYYLRNNIDFLYNQDKELSSDNFYSLCIEKHELAYLSILNSTFTRLEVLNKSRTQGNGLRKIQLYEFNEVNVININYLSNTAISELEILGMELLKTNRYKKEQEDTIEKIDILLLKEYNDYNNETLSICELQKELKEYFK